MVYYEKLGDNQGKNFYILLSVSHGAVGVNCCSHS